MSEVLKFEITALGGREAALDLRDEITKVLRDKGLAQVDMTIDGTLILMTELEGEPRA